MGKGIVSKVLDFSSHGPLISHLLAPLWIICIELAFLMLIGDWLFSHTLFNASSPGGEGFSPLPTSVSHMYCSLQFLLSRHNLIRGPSVPTLEINSSTC